MEILIESEKAKARLAHIDSHLNGNTFPLERLLLLSNRIVNVEENAVACINQLKSYAEAKAMSVWFNTGNLSQLKNWCYIRSKLEFIAFQPPYNETSGSMAFENRALHGLFYLISDHPDLILWYSNFDRSFDKDRIDNPKTFDYWTQQFFYALRGDWDVLIERCNRFLSNPPTGNREKRFLIDHKFYLALAKGEVSNMESIIKELVTKKMIANRVALEGGYLADLICSPAIIYSKVAWRHGYELEVSSPYIPKEWLPIKPLMTYEDAFDFIKSYQVSIN